MTPVDPTPAPDGALLDRYLAGDCTALEVARVRAWLDVDATHQAMLDRVVLMRGVVRETPSQIDTPRLWRDLVAQAPDLAERRVHAARPRVGVRAARSAHGPWIAWSMAGVAAAAGLAILMTSYVMFHPVPQPFREFVSAPGSRTTVVLRDGTRLVLGPETHLRVASDFGTTTRTLELTGEAEFTVVHNARHPLVVRTLRARLQDVGTTFVVRTYPEDANDRVAVQEGEVLLSRCGSALPKRSGAHPCMASNNATPLGAGDVASVDGATVSVAHGTGAAPLMAWLQGGLAFEDTPLREVVRELGRTYGVTITVADSSLLSQQVTATFTNEPLDIVLRGVTLAVGARYEHTARGGVVIRRAASDTTDHAVKPRQPIPASMADQSVHHTTTDFRGVHAER